MIYEAGLIQVAIVSEVEMWISQAEGAGVAGGVDASEEERGNLGAQLQVVQQLPRPGVLRPEQQICKAPALRVDAFMWSRILRTRPCMHGYVGMRCLMQGRHDWIMALLHVRALTMAWSGLQYLLKESELLPI